MTSSCWPNQPTIIFLYPKLPGDLQLHFPSFRQNKRKHILVPDNWRTSWRFKSSLSEQSHLINISKIVFNILDHWSVFASACLIVYYTCNLGPIMCIVMFRENILGWEVASWDHLRCILQFCKLISNPSRTVLSITVSLKHEMNVIKTHLVKKSRQKWTLLARTDSLGVTSNSRMS